MFTAPTDKFVFRTNMIYDLSFSIDIWEIQSTLPLAGITQQSHYFLPQTVIYTPLYDLDYTNFHLNKKFYVLVTYAFRSIK